MDKIMKELAHEARMDRNRNTEKKDGEEKKQAARAKTYELTLAEYPDFTITKTTARMKKTLVVMVSAGAGYIKTEQAGKEPVLEALNEDNYRLFSSDMPESGIDMPEGFWVDKAVKGVQFVRDLCRLLSNDILRDMICKKLIPDEVSVMEALHSSYHDWNAITFRRILEVYKKYPAVYRHVYGKEKSMELFIKEGAFVEGLVKTFGIDVAKRFFDAYEDSLSDFTADQKFSYSRGSYGWQEVFQYTFKPDSFINYVVYSSYRMGYAFSISDFITDWVDTLRMQQNIYGKIREKYPDDLPTMHRQLAQKSVMMKAAIDEKKFAEQSLKTQKYEGIYRNFIFVAPKEKQDFYDEAVMQANCLAGYVGRFTEGQCMILFMRRKKEPERSYITAEIVDGEVVQAKRARNAEVSREELEILKKWVSGRNSGAAEEKTA